MNETTDIEKFEQRNGDTLPTPGGQDTFLATIERLSARADIDVSKIEKIMDMQERVLDRNAKQAFNAAMVRVQNELQIVIRTKRNDQTNSNYAPLEHIERDGKPVYTKHGFSLMFYEGFATPEKPIKEGYVRTMCDVMHEQGHTAEKFADLPMDDSGIKGSVNKTQVHAKGSTFSYARRYLMCMIFNIPTGDDDDGNSAGGKVDEFISEDQAKELHNLISGCGDKAEWVVEKILALNKIETIDTLPASEFKQVATWINSTVKKAKK